MGFPEKCVDVRCLQACTILVVIRAGSCELLRPHSTIVRLHTPEHELPILIVPVTPLDVLRRKSFQVLFNNDSILAVDVVVWNSNPFASEVIEDRLPQVHVLIYGKRGTVDGDYLATAIHELSSIRRLDGEALQRFGVGWFCGRNAAEDHSNDTLVDAAIHE